MSNLNAGSLCRVVCAMLTIVACALPTNSQNRANTRPATTAFRRFTATRSFSRPKATYGRSSAKGGAARRLTSNPGEESLATISPDGKTVAFSAEYEGPPDVYTMPIDGGLPERRTWDGGGGAAGWTPDGRVLVQTGRYSTLPDTKLVAIDAHGGREIVPLAQAAEGSYSPTGVRFSSRDCGGSRARRSGTKAARRKISGGMTRIPKRCL